MARMKKTAQPTLKRAPALKEMFVQSVNLLVKQEGAFHKRRPVIAFMIAVS